MADCDQTQHILGAAPVLYRNRNSKIENYPDAVMNFRLHRPPRRRPVTIGNPFLPASFTIGGSRGGQVIFPSANRFPRKSAAFFLDDWGMFLPQLGSVRDHLTRSLPSSMRMSGRKDPARKDNAVFPYE